MALMEKNKPWLAFAGSCKLQCYVSSHLITRSAALSLPTSCSQLFVEEKSYIFMSCGSKSCLWGRVWWYAPPRPPTFLLNQQPPVVVAVAASGLSWTLGGQITTQ